MANKRNKKKVFNNKEYIQKWVFHKKNEALKFASISRQKGNRVIVDPGKDKGKDAYYIYIRKGARDS